MQINPDINISANTIHSYAPQEIIIYPAITQEEIQVSIDSSSRPSKRPTKTLRTPFIIAGNTLIEDWPVASAAEINRDNFQQIIDLGIEIFIIGTGKRIIFPNPREGVFLQQNGVGMEVMNTEAACRTYNFLVSDGRKVAAAMFMIDE